MSESIEQLALQVAREMWPSSLGETEDAKKPVAKSENSSPAALPNLLIWPNWLPPSRNSRKRPSCFFPGITLHLAPGEHYAGIITGKEGEPSYHLVLLPGQATHVTWENATEWAAKQGGEHVFGGLPSRREQALLYANLKEEFEELYYWSFEVGESASDCAWYQDFYRGHQRCCDRDDQLRARAVRRVFVK